MQRRRSHPLSATSPSSRPTPRQSHPDHDRSGSQPGRIGEPRQASRKANPLGLAFLLSIGGPGFDGRHHPVRRGVPPQPHETASAWLDSTCLVAFNSNHCSPRNLHQAPQNGSARLSRALGAGSLPQETSPLQRPPRLKTGKARPSGRLRAAICIGPVKPCPGASLEKSNTCAG